MNPYPISRRLCGDVVAAGTSLALLSSIVAGATGPARQALALVVLLFAPGWALVAPLRIRDLELELITSIAVSIVVGAVLSLVAVWIGGVGLGSAVAVVCLIAPAALIARHVGARVAWPRREELHDGDVAG